MSMKVVIIEDEELSALKLQNLLLQIDNDIEVSVEDGKFCLIYNN